MPLHTLPAPAAAHQAVLAALNSPAATRGTPVLHAAAGPVTTTHPHPVYVLDDAVVAPVALRAARLVGWRFLITVGDKVVAGAETVPAGQGWVFSHFSDGPFVTATNRALRQARSLPGRYQTRLLSVPSLYMLALWLHNKADADDDLLIPLAPAPLGVPAHRPHRASELLSALSPRLTAGARLLSTTA